MRKLKELILSITNRCNYRCKMCDIPFIKTEELSTAEYKKIIKDASGLGVQTVVLSGGEPLLRPDIYDLISFTKSHNMSACLTSNGSLIDEAAASRLSKAGVNVVNISIEGRKPVHDALRGEGTYDLAAIGLTNLRKHKIETTIAATVSRYNFESISSIVDIAREFGATTARFQPFNDLFIADKTRGRDFFIPDSDRARAEQAVEALITSARERGIATNPESYLRNIPHYLCTGKALFRGACNALSYSCPVDSAGNVFPCWNKTGSGDRIGNVRKSNLSELWFSKKREDIIGSITGRGCAGCMMACYDEVFGKADFKGFVSKKIAAAGRKDKKELFHAVLNRVAQSIKGELTTFRLRLRFYKSYKGSFPELLRRRIKAGFRARMPVEDKGRFGRVLAEIDTAKKRLNREIRKY